MQAYPNKQDLVKAIKGRMRSSSGKKKLSRLKRLILREKTDKAVEAAVVNVLAAQAAAKKAEAAHVSVSQSLQVDPGTFGESRLKKFWGNDSQTAKSCLNRELCLRVKLRVAKLNFKGLIMRHDVSPARAKPIVELYAKSKCEFARGETCPSLCCGVVLTPCMACRTPS